MTTAPKLSTLGVERTSPSSNVTLLPDSPRTQIIDPSVDIDVTLPNVDTWFRIENKSDNTITVKAADASTRITIKRGFVLLTANTVTPGTSGSWDLLDTREEGVWTPSLTGISNISSFGAVSNAYYTKIGRKVFISFFIADIQIVSSNNEYSFIALSNLPYDMADNVGISAASVGGTISLIGPSNQRVQNGELIDRGSGDATDLALIWSAGPTNIGIADARVSGFYDTEE